MSDKPWITNKPEQRLSIAFDRLLKDTLLRPHYFTAIHDSDGGARTQLQRVRDKNRGIASGQLDWEVTQGTAIGPLVRKVELKRGKNGPTAGQIQTIKALTECGAPPVVAWDLRQAIDGLHAEGFRFAANLETRLQHWTEQLAAWDREADAILSGAVVKKKPKSRKAEPRFQGRTGLWLP